MIGIALAYFYFLLNSETDPNVWLNVYFWLLFRYCRLVFVFTKLKSKQKYLGWTY
jgi:hypothetical protein